MFVVGVGASPCATTRAARRQPFDRGHLHHRPGRDAEPARVRGPEGRVQTINRSGEFVETLR